MLSFAVIMKATSLIQSTNHNVEWYYINTNACLLIYKFLPSNFLISHLIIGKSTKECNSANQTNNYPHLSFSFSTISETFAARSTGPKFNVNTDLWISLLYAVTKHNVAQTRQNNYLLWIFTLVATTENSPHQTTNRVGYILILDRYMANKSLFELPAAFPQLLTIHQAHTFWPLSHNTITYSSKHALGNTKKTVQRGKTEKVNTILPITC